MASKPVFAAVFALIVHVFSSSIRAVCQLEHLRIQIYTIYTFYTAIKEGFATVSDEKEFLGPFGIHSLSKKDIAYDENDVDNGGPGACISFAPAVVDRLYRSGHVKEAETIFKRLWWLGGALPYWGDSHYADRMDYRRDTPLQNDIQGAALAQTIIFGLLGIEPRIDGSIDVNPHLPEGVNHMNLRGVKLAGRNFDVLVDRVKGVKVVYHSPPPR